MIYFFTVIAICVTLLVLQAQHYDHRVDVNRVHILEDRLNAIEQMRQTEYDHEAFEELKSKVDALRISQGLRR